MKKKFGELNPEKKHKRFAGKWQYGEVLFGIIIVSLLILGTCWAYIEKQELLEIDVPNQPPANIKLQQLLHKPDTFKVSYRKINQFSQSFFNNWNASSEEIQYQVLSGPDNMDFDNATGVLRWTPNIDHRGTQIIKIRLFSGKEEKILSNIRPDFAAVVGEGYYCLFPAYAIQTPDTVYETLIQFPITVSSQKHILGTDVMGRDLMSSLILGSKWTVLPGFIVAFISVFLGAVLGGIAGYFGGHVDRMLGLIAQLFAAFPSLLIIFLVAAIFNFNIYLIMIAIGILAFPQIALTVKNKVMVLKNRQFIEAAQELGLRDMEILWKDIMWYNLRSMLLSFMTYGFALAILMEVTLSYLNLGVQGKSESWGNLLKYGREQMYQGQYWLVFIPVVAVLVSIMGFYLLGDGIRKLSMVEDAQYE
ncbi:ABC transporter permease [bacterium]|nr:ABC transporter permease [bacterium]